MDKALALVVMIFVWLPLVGFSLLISWALDEDRKNENRKNEDKK